jgi:putative MATE family efflux protein
MKKNLHNDNIIRQSNGGFIMSSNSKIFEEEKISKLLVKFSVPIVFSLLVSELYNMVDTFFVGRVIGGNGIGALGVVFPIQRIIVALSVLISVGTSTAFSRSNGKKDTKKSKRILENGFTLSYCIMIPLTIFLYFCKEQVLIIFGASKDILPLAQDYLGLILFGSVFLSLTIFISDIMVALGNSKISIISTSIGAIINVILDYITVMHMNMGVKGAALATSVSQFIGFIYAYYNYRKMTKEFNVSLRFELDKKIIMPIVLVGVSAFIVEAEDGILMAVLNNLLKGSDMGIIVLGVISKVYMFLFVTLCGIASAMQPIAAYNIGSKNYKRLKSIMKKTNLYAFVTSTIIWAISMIFAPQFIQIFVKDAEIIKESAKAFRIMISVFPVISVYYVSIYYFQARGNAKTSVLLSVSRQLLIMIPISVILVKGFNLGQMGVWISYPISDILASLGSYMLIKNEGMELNIAIRKQNEIEKTKGQYILN